MSGPGRLEVIARHICAADGVNPDKEVCGMGVQLPAGEIAPAWRARMRQAEAVWDLFVDWGFQPYPDEGT